MLLIVYCESLNGKVQRHLFLKKTLQFEKNTKYYEISLNTLFYMMNLFIVWCFVVQLRLQPPFHQR